MLITPHRQQLLSNGGRARIFGRCLARNTDDDFTLRRFSSTLIWPMFFQRLDFAATMPLPRHDTYVIR